MSVATRQSNMELLRIVAMIMVVVLHFDGASLGLPQPEGDIASVSAGDWWKMIVESFAIVGVNCFVLISGYFGINLRWSALWRYTLQCLFYTVGIYLVVAAFGHRFEWSKFADYLHIFTDSPYWFVPAYLGLLLFSPAINAAMQAMSRTMTGVTILMLLLVNCYAGWYVGMDFNRAGYTTVNFIMLYAIARYIRIYLPALTQPRLPLRLAYLATYLIATAMTVALLLFDAKAIYYNSPFVIMASVALMLLFATLRFQSNIINFFASSAFSVYLVHMHPELWIRIKTMVISSSQSMNMPQFALWCLSAISVLFVGSVLLDKVRIWLIDSILRPFSSRK